MRHRQCKKTDGVRYVTKRLQANSELLRTISHSNTICNHKKSNIDRQIESIYNILKSRKHN